MEKRDVFRALLVKKTAEIEEVSLSSVRRIMNDRQNNEEVYDTFILLKEEVSKAFEQVKLAREVEKLIPFN